MKKILLPLLPLLLCPLLSHATCSKEELEQKETAQLRFRLDILKGQKKYDDFVKKTEARLNRKSYMDYRAEVMAGKGSDAAKRETLCTLVDGFIVMADDMLAGGDGSGNRTPWKKHTPEAVYAQKLAFDRLCDGEYKQACKSDEIGVTAMQFIPLEQSMEAMTITPGEYVDQGYALYQQLLDTLKRKHTQRPE